MDSILFFKIRIHSYFCRILKVSSFDQTGRPPEAGKLFMPEATLNTDTRNFILKTRIKGAGWALPTFNR